MRHTFIITVLLLVFGTQVLFAVSCINGFRLYWDNPSWYTIPPEAGLYYNTATQTYEFTKDITLCSGQSITLQADSGPVKIDGKGYALIGNDQCNDGRGIFINGATGTVISNLAVQGFFRSIQINNGVNNIIQDSTLQQACYVAIEMRGNSASGNIIRRNNLQNNAPTQWGGLGVDSDVQPGSNNRIYYNNFINNKESNIAGANLIVDDGTCAGNYFDDNTGSPDPNNRRLANPWPDGYDRNSNGIADCVDGITQIYGCSVINSPGIYVLNNAIFGQPNRVASWLDTCIVIRSSNVFFDCGGYGITSYLGGYGAPNPGATAGIAFDGSINNIKVMNCPISGYYYGVMTLHSYNDTIVNSTAYNSTYGFFVDYSRDIVFVNDTARNNQIGFYMSNNSRNTIATNSIAHSNSQSGFYAWTSPNNTLTGNTAYNNSQAGFSLQSGSNNVVRGNAAYNNSQPGFVFLNSSNNTIENNAAYDNADIGFDIVHLSSNNSLTNNTAYNNSRGFYFYNNSASNTLVNNTAYNNANSGFEFMESSGNSTLINNTAYENSINGFYILISPDNDLEGNTANNNGYAGFNLYITSNNDIINNTASGNGYYGFALAYWSSNNVIEENTASNSRYGFSLTHSTYSNALADNIAHDNSIFGFVLYNDSNWNTLTNNLAYNVYDPTGDINYSSGFNIDHNSNSNFLIGNTAYNCSNGFYLKDNSVGNQFYGSSVAYGNSRAGFLINSSNNTILGGSEIHGNPGFGLQIINSSGTQVVNWNHYYNDSMSDISVNNSESTSENQVGISGLLISNPAGDWEQTFLSLNDSAAPGDAYLINWTAVPYPIPPGFDSFFGKMLNVSVTAGAPSIDSISFGWAEWELDPEWSPYNEAKLVLLKYNGAWSLANYTPDTDANILSQYGLASFSQFGIFEDVAPPEVTIENPVQDARYNTRSVDLNYSVFNDLNLDSCWFELDGNSIQGDTSGPSYKIIRITNTTYPPSTIGSINSADAKCQLEFGSDYKALIGDQGVRDNTLPGWVLTADTEYRKPDGNTIVGSTDSNGCFAFPLNNPVYSDGWAGVWTGLNSSCQAPGSDCDGWTAEPPVKGISGAASSIDEGLLVANPGDPTWCYYPFHIYCVSQTPIPLPNCNNFTMTGLSDGQHNITVYANDHAGNTNSSTVIFTVDLSRTTITSLEVSVSSTCDGNTVTVTADGREIGGVRLTIGDSVYRTDSSGTAKFNGCGNTVTIHASKDGYAASDSTETLIACAECAVPVQPPTPPTPPTPPGCRAPACCGSDNDCADTYRCAREAGAATGRCVEITGCGLVANHALTPWECGGAGCPSCAAGSSCTNHVCVKANVTQPPLVKPPVTEQPPITRAVSDNTLPILIILLLLIAAIVLYLKRKRGKKSDEAAPKKAKVVKPKDSEE